MNLCVSVNHRFCHKILPCGKWVMITVWLWWGTYLLLYSTTSLKLEWLHWKSVVEQKEQSKLVQKQTQVFPSFLPLKMSDFPLKGGKVCKERRQEIRYRLEWFTDQKGSVWLMVQMESQEWRHRMMGKGLVHTCVFLQHVVLAPAASASGPGRDVRSQRRVRDFQAGEGRSLQCPAVVRTPCVCVWGPHALLPGHLIPEFQMMHLDTDRKSSSSSKSQWMN